MRRRSAGRKLLSMVAVGVLAGALLAVAALPAAALAGLITNGTTDAYLDLPSDLSIPPTAQVSYVYARDGRTLLTTFYDQNRRNVQLAEVATVMQQAIVAAEDTRFYQHGGADLRSIL